MNVSYARSKLPVSIFLAGPTPRPLKDGRKTPDSWRPAALDIFKSYNFDGTIFVPESGDGSRQFSYDDQVEWELQALHSSTVVMFWIPRTEDMPAYTTNVEFGMFISRPNTVMGSPVGADKMKYLEHVAHMYGKKVHATLAGTCYAAMVKTIRPFQTSELGLDSSSV